MRHLFISERCKIFGLLLLLAAGSAALRAQDQPGIKNIRTVVYEPLLKDTTWVTGKVVDYITFVKYDSCLLYTSGVVGIASYIGAGLQDVMSGVLLEGNKTVVNGADVYDFTYINWFWIVAAILSVLVALLVWNARNKEPE